MGEILKPRSAFLFTPFSHLGGENSPVAPLATVQPSLAVFFYFQLRQIRKCGAKPFSANLVLLSNLSSQLLPLKFGLAPEARF